MSTAPHIVTNDEPDLTAEELDAILADAEVQKAQEIAGLGNEGGWDAKLKFASSLVLLKKRGLALILREDNPNLKLPLKVVGSSAAAAQGRDPKSKTAALSDFQNLPHNPEIEANALACLIQFPTLREKTLERLDSKHFHIATNRYLATAIHSLHARGPFDVALLLSYLGNEKILHVGVAEEDVKDLSSRRVNHANLASYADELAALAERREALVMARATTRRLERGANLADVEAQVFELAARVDRKDPSIVESFRSWPAPPAAAAWRGVAGELVMEVAPCTEADPVAILVQLLVAFGSVIRRGAHWSVESTEHYTNLFACLVGQTGRGRKGTAWRVVRKLLGTQDPVWLKECIQGGLSTGEGLIKTVRDPAYIGEAYDEGVVDKCGCWVEVEFGGTLAMMSRENNSLSNYLRKAWDGEDLRAATKADPVSSTAPHISLIGHTTFHDLETNLSANNLHNGLSNRIIWLCVKRSKELPDGGDMAKLKLGKFTDRIAKAVEFGRNPRRALDPIEFDPIARARWRQAYPILTRVRPGKLGPVTDRAEAQVRRLAVIYALLDCSAVVKDTHLESALALWDYSERSAAYIFGDSMGSPETQKLYQAIEDSGRGGLTRTEIKRKVFSNRKTADHYLPLLEALVRSGLVKEAEARSKPGVMVFLTVGNT